MKSADRSAAELKAWLTPETFDYVQADERLAVVRLLARLESELCPPGASLVVHRGPVSTSHPAFASTAEHRRGGRRSADELLWCASFAVPLTVIEFPHALFEISAPDRLTLGLPVPELRNPTAEEQRRMQAVAAANRRAGHHRAARRAVGLAAAMVIAGAGTGAIHTASAVIFPQGGSAPAASVQASRPPVSPRPALPVLPRPSAQLSPTPPSAGANQPIIPRTSSAPSAPSPPPAPAPSSPAPTATSSPGAAAAPTSGQSQAPAHSAAMLPAHGSSSGRTGSDPSHPGRKGAQPCATVGIWRHDQKPPRKSSTTCGPAHHHAPGAPKLVLPTGGVGLPELSPVPPVKLPSAPAPVRAPASASPAPVSATPAPGPAAASPWSTTLGFDGSTAAAFSHFSQLFTYIAGPPPFLIPIYQQAARRYHVPWEILAAINSVETDYGRNLSVSSAGAIGWMQFMPGTWAQYAVRAHGKGKPSPYNPWDAVFSAARYLAANGGAHNIRRAIFAYNHATWYVDEVVWRAKLVKDHARPIKRAPKQVDQMLTEAVSLLGRPYIWGGGHSQTNWLNAPGYDCSGFVSAVLGAGKRLSGPQSTQTLPSQPGIQPGPGHWVTVFDRTDGGAANLDHVIIEVAGNWFESGGNSIDNPFGGVAPIAPPSISYLRSFNLILHPRGL